MLQTQQLTYQCPLLCLLCSVTLDTPANRKGMPNADFNQWTPLQEVAE